MELASDPLNGKFLCRQDRRINPKGKEKLGDDIHSLNTALRRIVLATVNKRVERNPRAKGPYEQCHVSAQHREPVDVAPGANQNDTNRDARQSRERPSKSRSISQSM
jgi:hypothetical protein